MDPEQKAKSKKKKKKKKKTCQYLDVDDVYVCNIDPLA